MLKVLLARPWLAMGVVCVVLACGALTWIVTRGSSDDGAALQTEAGFTEEDAPAGAGNRSGAGRRIALLIGNAAYDDNVGPLKNPINDITAVRSSLLEVGFSPADIQSVPNAGRKEMLRAIEGFAKKVGRLRNNDIAFFYYSGHGVQRPGTSTNFLIPVDATDPTTSDFYLDSVSLQESVIKPLGENGLPAVIVAVDACRNELRLPGKSVAGGKGLVPPPQMGGMLISFAADEGQTASDGSHLSPYAQALSAELRVRGRSISATMTALRPSVVKLTGGLQQPVLAIKLNSDPVLVPVEGGGAVDRVADLSSRPPVELPEPLEPDTTEEASPPAEQVSEPAVGSGTPAGTVFRDEGCPGGCPEMVVVPSGSFMMGSPSGEEGRDTDEGPQHSVTVSRSFAVGKFEVTRGEWRRFVEETGRGAGDGCHADDGTGNWQLSPQRNWQSPGFSQTDQHPVVCVSWEGAQAYVKWLSGKTGQTYRLLSEAEWEYAARGRTTSRFIWGSDANGGCDMANGADQSAKRTLKYDWTYSTCDDGAVHTAPAGRYAANGFGLHDMIGNVWEWTEDCYNETYAGAPDDGSAWRSGDCQSRAVRGGSWFSDPRGLRSADRGRYSPTNRSDSGGFRVARTL